MIELYNENDKDYLNNKLFLFDSHLNVQIIFFNPFSFIYLYKVGNINAGFIVFSKYYERVEIDYIYVNDEYRKCGIGSKLISFLISSSNGISSITLEVDIDNFVAINMYKKFEFHVVSIRKNYFKNGNDAYLMERKM